MISQTPSSEIHALEYRTLGSTSLRVSILGFGASPLGDVFGITDPAEGRRAVEVAIDKGINFFDVSPYYGLTLAEERLGAALAGKRDRVVLSTKCGRYGFDRFDFSAKRVTASIDESLKRLRTDYVDLLQAHDVEFGDLQQITDETIPAMRRLQEQGKARFIGISGYPLKTLVRIAETVPVDTVLSYCRYNLLITDMDDVLLPVVKKHGIGLINASPLHMGILTPKGPPDWHPAPAELLEAGRRAEELCRSRGIGISELALRFCLDHPFVATTLVGMSSWQQVEANFSVLQSSTNQRLTEEVRMLLAPVMNFVWTSGRPENRDAIGIH
jgi:L-galactose dehydrogenase